jgi:uncharacterized membrane protein (DUF106 family)
MSILNSLLGLVFDGLLYPFRTAHPMVGLLVLSVLTAIAMLLVFKATSDQKAIAAVKRQIHAGLFEIRLFNDDFRAIFRAQGEILRHNLSYLRLSLVPLIVVLPPLVLVVAQLQFRYGYHPLAPGQTTLFEVTLVEGWQRQGRVPRSETTGKPLVQLEVPAGLTMETPSVWVPSERTLTWRLGVEEPGRHTVSVVVGEERFEKALDGRPGVLRRSPVRPGGSALDQLVYPAEAPLPREGPLARIEVGLPSGEVPVLGFTLRELAGVPAWMIAYFVLAVVFAFALRRPFGVQI